MQIEDQSQTNTNTQGRDAAIQIINGINTVAVVTRGLKMPSHNTLIEILAPFAFAALVLSFFYPFN